MQFKSPLIAPSNGPDLAASSSAGQSEEKRRQILSGAREVFLGSGFDGASMGEIARIAGVSKGTLYVYFGSKEDLFAALVSEECSQTAERCFVLDTDADVRATLTETGHRYLEAMIRPEHIATVRMVLGVAEKFPKIGKTFLSAGQETGVARLSAWLRVKVERGELAIDDYELAAWQFMIGCHALIVMPMLFGGRPSRTRSGWSVWSSTRWIVFCARSALGRLSRVISSREPEPTSLEMLQHCSALWR